MSGEFIELKRGLPDLIKGCGVETEMYKIDYEYIPSSESNEVDQTVSEYVSVVVHIKNKMTGQAIRHSATLLEVPVETPFGYKINGTFYTPMGVDMRAPGWYITHQGKDNKGNPNLICEFIPLAGLRITMDSRYSDINVMLGSQKKKDSKIPIGVFLKALTGKTYKELALKLGVKNKYVVSSLINEPSRDECIDRTLACLVSKVDTLPGEYKYKELMRRIYHNKFMKTGNARQRTERNCSFQSRALYKELAKPVLGYEKGITLTNEILKEIDDSGIDTLFVSYNHKIYELKKYALGEGDLSEQELLNLVNMYAVAKDGYPTLDDRYELFNRKIDSYKDLVYELLEASLLEINDQVSQLFLYYDVDANLKNLELKHIDIDRLITRIKSSSTDAQTSETTNFISVESKKQKVVADYSGRAGEDMVKVKDSDLGIFDTFQQPESKKVGLVNYLTMTAQKGEDGIYRSTYVPVKDGIAESAPVLLGPYEITNSYIAPWEEDLTKSKVRCYYNGRVVNVPRDKVQYQEYSALNNLSLPTAIIPFMNFDNGKRLVMSDNQSKQTLLTLKRSRPMVSTGVTGLYDYGVVRAKTILEKYFLENQGFVKYSYDDFIQLPIKLKTTDLSTPGYRKLCFHVVGDEETLIDYIIPFCRKTTDNSLTQYEIRSAKDFIYQGDDIVVYDNSFDINKYDLDTYVDLGHMKVENHNVFNTELALGNNINIAYKTFGSTNLDDGMTISAGILGTNKYAHVYMYEVKAELKDGEYFGILGRLKNFEKNGLPKVGTFLKPKSIAISKYMETDTNVKDTSIRLDNITEGEVIQAIISGKYATVIIAKICEISVGDKLTGNHGNKGVVARIVPESWMPYTEDGVVMDLCLNPLGIPSRMNEGQLMEGIMGLALRKLGNNKRAVISPGFKDSINLVREYAEKAGIKPEYLYDGRTGKRFDRPSTYVVSYIKKLSHTAISKSNSTGITNNINPTTMQSVKGKKAGGGQTIGEMEMWALASMGALQVMQEFMTIQSDDIGSRRAIEQYAEGASEDVFDNKNNNNDSALYAILRPMGVDVVNDENGSYSLKIMTDKDICALARKPIENHKDSLHDPDIFGFTQDPKMLPLARQKWGYMNLHCEIINPLWIYKGKVPKLLIVNEIYREDNKIQRERTIALNNTILREIIEGKKFISIDESRGTVNYSVKGDFDGYIWITGMPAVVSAFKHCKLSDAKAFWQDAYASLNPNPEEEYKLLQLMTTIELIEKNNMDLKDFVISHYPIMPETFRLPIDGRSADFDLYYEQIIAKVQANKNVEQSTDIFKKITGFLGLDAKYELPADKKARTLLTYFTGKGQDNQNGFIRDKMLTKIIYQSMRTVIVPAEEGSITPLQIGLPYTLAVNCLRTFIRVEVKKKYDMVKALSEEGPVLVDEFIDAVVNKDDDVIATILEMRADEALELLRDARKFIKDYIEENAVASAGRQPTLHKFGIRGFRVVLFDDNAMHIHPLVCSGYNADFDGDQMWSALSITESARKEVLEKMSPSVDMINPKDGSFVLNPTQDILLGCYLSTMLFENKLSIEGEPRYDSENIIYYNNLEMLQYDFEVKNIRPQVLVCYRHTNGKLYLSTAGRVLFNSLLPDAFTEEVFTNTLNIPFIKNENYCELAFDGLIRKKADKSIPLRTYAMSEVVKYIYSRLNGEQTCLVLDKILKFGVFSCDTSGISLGLEDFIEHPEIDKMIAESEKIIDKIHKYYELGLITEYDRKASSTKIYKYMLKHIESTLLSYYSRNNNLFIIMDSGSRGNLAQLMQTCGLIGIQAKTNNESLESPVLSNYIRGMSSSDQRLVSYGTRMGVSSVQLDTAKAGELTRNSVYTLSNFKIVEHDCGNEDNEVKVLYSDEILSSELSGQALPLIDMLDLDLDPTDENYDKFVTLSGDKIGTNTIYFIKKNRIRTIKTTSGVIRIRYKLSALFRNLMLHRVGKELRYLEGSSFGGVTTNTEPVEGIITKKTLDWIEQENLVTIKARTMLDCHSVGGVCAKCYGIKETNNKYPRIGENIGVTAAQAVGEPATQLNLGRINQGGAAEGSVANGVETFKSYVNGSVPQKGARAIMSNSTGYVKVSDMGKDYALIESGPRRYKVHKSLCLVKDNEYVHKGDILADGVINVNDIKLDDNFETIRKRQIELLTIFYDIFMNNGIDISVRNFECIVRVQTSIVRVIGSSDENFKSGHSYFLQELLNGADDSVKFYHRVENTTNVINKYAGFTTNLSFVNFAENLANMTLVPDKQSCKERGFLGQIVVGEDVTRQNPKRMNTLTFNTVDSSDEFNNIDDSSFENIESIIKVETLQDDFASLDSLDLFSDLDALMGATETTDEVSNNTETSDLMSSHSFDDELDLLDEEDDYEIASPQNSSDENYLKVKRSSSFSE